MAVNGNPQAANDSESSLSGLDAKQEKALLALLHERTIKEAAKKAGIGETTLIRWMRGEAFSTAYRDARRDVVTQSIAQLQGATGAAVETLLSVASDTTAPASSRVSAARAILDTAIRAVEIEDTHARLESLEAAVNVEGKR